MSLSRKAFSFIGLAPNDEERALMSMVNASYTTLRVVGRGTVTIDVKEVRNDPGFRAACQRAKVIVQPEYAAGQRAVMPVKQFTPEKKQLR